MKALDYFSYLFFKPIELLMETIFVIIWRVFGSTPAIFIVGIIMGSIFIIFYLILENGNTINREKIIRKDIDFSCIMQLIIPFLLFIIYLHTTVIFLGNLCLIEKDSFLNTFSWVNPDNIILGRLNLFPFISMFLCVIPVFVRKEKSFLYAIGRIIIGLTTVVVIYQESFALSMFWCINFGMIILTEVISRYVIFLKKKKKLKLDEKEDVLNEIVDTEKNDEQPESEKSIKRKRELVFPILGIAYMIVFIGCFIPTNMIKDSVAEFVDTANPQSPLHYLIYSMTLALGGIGIWTGILLYYANTRVKRIINILIWTICFASSLDYIMAGSYWGEVSSTFIYFGVKEFEWPRQIINIFLIVFISVAIIFAINKKNDVFRILVYAETIILVLSIIINAISIEKKYAELDYLNRKNGSAEYINLSKNGKNVIVLIMDKALGTEVPFIFSEKPELKNYFDGFTYYPNTVSLGAFTNAGIPSVYGGFEYSPEKMNAREEESLKDKHDEALKVLPVLFYENGYNVTVCDPAYAGYQWIPDLSIYDDYPEIKAFNTQGKFDSLMPEDSISSEDIRRRNFYMHSLMKCFPLSWQTILYNNGNYCNAEFNEINAHSGYNNEFLEWYLILDNLENFTSFSEGEKDSFLLFYNAATHEPCQLQEPDYIPAKNVNNEAYHTNDKERFKVNDVTLRVESESQLEHYQVNMAMYLQLGKWFEYLKENDCYDNTRIIIVSDHGRYVHHFDLITDQNVDMEFFMPVLMVKDFNASGFKYADDFMVNADTAFLATQHIIKDPVNPFTGNRLDDVSYKKDGVDVYFSYDCDLEETPWNRFSPGEWFHIKDNPYRLENWTYIGNY